MIDAVFILRRIQKKHHAKENSCICALWTKRKRLTEYKGKCWNGH